MDTPATQAGATARLAETLLNPAPRDLETLSRAEFGDEPHLTPLARTITGWLARPTRPKTRGTYASDITDYLVWCARTRQLPLHVPPAPGPIATGIGPHTFTAYELHLRAQDHWSEHSICRKISVVSSFYRYAATTEEIPRNPRTGYRFGTPAPTGTRLTPDHLDALQHTAANPPRAVHTTRTRGPLILRLLECGARPGELLTALRAHLDLTATPPALTIPRPRRTDDTTPAPDRLPLTEAAVTAILADWNAHGRPAHTDHLLRTSTGAPLTTDALHDYVRALSLRAHVYPPATADEIRLAYRHHRAHGTPPPATPDTGPDELQEQPR
jgi:integrase